MGHVLSYRVGTLQHPHLPLERVAQLGIGGIELVWNDQTTAAAVRAAVGAAGLLVTSVSASGALGDSDLCARLERQAEAAAQVGAGYLFVSMHAGEMAREEAYARLRQAGDVVGRYQVFLALETHPDLCQNASDMRRTMAAVDHPWVGVNFDTGNIYYYNEAADAVAEAKAAAVHVRGVHLKDTMGGFHDGEFPEIGAGIVDFAAIGRALDEAGYAGPYCMELEGAGFDPRRPDELAAKVARCVAHVRSAGLVG
jgi:inosose dehydratase